MRRLILLLLVLLLLCSSCRKAPASDGDHSGDLETDNTNWEGLVIYDGVEYRRRTDVKNILFIGVDNTELVEAEGDAIGNNGRADALMLFILDTKTQETELLTISRDTMTEVDVYKGNGDRAYSGVMQINMQYAFGDSAHRSCFLTSRTVSELLYNTRIDGYFSLTMDGIAVIVDTLGGIELTMPEDYTMIDGRYTAGATVTLDGQAAERFVRYRDLTVNGSNEDRAERQSWFINKMFQQMNARGDLQGTLEKILEVADSYIETDVDADTISLLAGSSISESYKVPGESRIGRLHNEFYVDEEELRALILQLFYRPVE